MNYDDECIKKIQHERTDYKHASQVRTLAKSLIQLSTGIYTEPERFVYELLQNAVDAFSDTSEDTLDIRIKIVGEKFIFMHNGKGFDEKDVDGICDVGNGTKANDNNKIGYKGIGFKSVFMSSVKRVSIISGNFHFIFDRDCAFNMMPVFPNEEKLSPDEIPWQVIPIDAPELKSFDTEGYNVVTIVETTKFNEIFRNVESFFKDLQFLLFLRSKNVRISFERNGILQFSARKMMRDCYNSNSFVTLYKNDLIQSEWLIHTDEVNVPNDVKESIARDFNTPEKLKGAQSLDLSFAVQIKDDKVRAVEKSTIYAFLPTSYRRLKEPFLINANFITDAGRQHLHQESEWNKFIFKLIPQLYLNFLATFSSKYDNYTDVLPTLYPDNDSLTNVYRSALNEALDKIAFIPDSKHKAMLKVKNAYIDYIGITDLLSTSVFVNFLNKKYNKCFDLNSLISNNGNIILKSYGVFVFDKEALFELFNDNDILSNINIETDSKFVQLLFQYYQDHEGDRADICKVLRGAKFLLDEKCELCRACDIFLPSEAYVEGFNKEDVDMINVRLYDKIVKIDGLIKWLTENIKLKEISNLNYVDHILDHHEYITIDNAIKVGRALFEIWKKERFLDNEEYSMRIKALPFLTQTGELRSIGNLFLSSCYQPEDDLESKAPNLNIFVSCAYAQNDYEDWSYFLKKCGAVSRVGLVEKIIDNDAEISKYEMLSEARISSRKHDHPLVGYCGFENPVIFQYFSLNYFSFIDPLVPNKEVDQYILSKILSTKIDISECKEIIHGIISYWNDKIEFPLKDHISYIYQKYNTFLEYCLGEKQMFPTSMGTEEYANNVYLNTPQIRDLAGKYLPVLDIPSEVHSSWREILHFKETLTLSDYLTILKRISNDPEEDNKERISQIYQKIVDLGLHCNSEISEWGKTNKILSSKGNKFYLPKDLSYITVDGFKDEHKAYVGKLSESNKDCMYLLLENFGVKVITKLTPVFSNEIINDELKNRLKNKAKFITLLGIEDQNQSCFFKRYKELSDRINSTKFYHCEGIKLSYGKEDDVISKTTYAIDGSFFYTSSIKPTMIEPLIPFLSRYLGVQYHNNEMLILLITDSDDDISKYLEDKGYNISLLPKQDTVDGHLLQPTSEEGDENGTDSGIGTGTQTGTQTITNGTKDLLPDWESVIAEFMGNSYQLPKDEILRENIIIRWRVLDYLKRQNTVYHIDSTCDKNYEKDYVMGYEMVVPLSDGRELIAQGAKGGIWYISPNVWRGFEKKKAVVCLCVGDGDDDFVFASSLKDVELYTSTANVLVKITPNEKYSMMNSISSVFPGSDNYKMNIHLMLRIRETKNVVVDNIFDKVFNTKTDDFNF
jgi:hypothetical protein